jgi:hypothetical protein
MSVIRNRSRMHAGRCWRSSQSRTFFQSTFNPRTHATMFLNDSILSPCLHSLRQLDSCPRHSWSFARRPALLWKNVQVVDVANRPECPALNSAGPLLVQTPLHQYRRREVCIGRRASDSATSTAHRPLLVAAAGRGRRAACKSSAGGWASQDLLVIWLKAWQPGLLEARAWAVWPFAVRAGRRRSPKACFPFQPPRSECAILPRFAQEHWPDAPPLCACESADWFGSGAVPNARPSQPPSSDRSLPLSSTPPRHSYTDTGPPLSSSFSCCPSPSVFFPLWCWIYLCFPVVWLLPFWCVCPLTIFTSLGARACIAAGDAHCRGAASANCASPAARRTSRWRRAGGERPCSLTSAARTPPSRARSQRAAMACVVLRARCWAASAVVSLVRRPRMSCVCVWSDRVRRLTVRRDSLLRDSAALALSHGHRPSFGARVGVPVAAFPDCLLAVCGLLSAFAPVLLVCPPRPLRSCSERGSLLGHGKCSLAVLARALTPPPCCRPLCAIVPPLTIAFADSITTTLLLYHI